VPVAVCVSCPACQNGAACTAGGACNCTAPYSGRYCQIRCDDGAPTTCDACAEHTGSCVCGECLCEKGYMGDDCSDKRPDNTANNILMFTILAVDFILLVIVALAALARLRRWRWCYPDDDAASRVAAEDANLGAGALRVGDLAANLQGVSPALAPTLLAHARDGALTQDAAALHQFTMNPLDVLRRPLRETPQQLDEYEML
jgi:hypothetical protein